MQCERLVGLIKSWYGHVQNETMAPARMIMFIEQHAERCDICLADSGLQQEIAKITEMILPESKIPKSVRDAADVDDDDIEGEEDSTDDTEDDEEEDVYDADVDDDDDEV